MSINRDKFGAMLFLCLALIYGYYVGDIPLLFGDEDAPFNARTLPNAIAWFPSHNWYCRPIERPAASLPRSVA